MNYNSHPTGSKKFFLIKRWDTYKFWIKNGNWNRTINPNENSYATNSVQLYKYEVISDDLFKSMIHEDQVDHDYVSDAPAYDSNKFIHNVNTFINTPNSTQNNMAAAASWTGVRNLLIPGSYYINNDSYFEISYGYPRNHYTHKRSIFSPYRLQKFEKEGAVVTSGVYVRSQQTNKSTIGEDGLEDGTDPIQTFDVSNVNIIQSTNVINQ